MQHLSYPILSLSLSVCLSVSVPIPVCRSVHPCFCVCPRPRPPPSLPPSLQGSGLSLASLSSILPQLFRVVVSNAGCLDETYHLTLGLLGQLLLRIPPAEADGAVGEALADKYELLAQLEAAGTETPGWKTTQLLFCLGAVCLDR